MSDVKKNGQVQDGLERRDLKAGEGCDPRHISNGWEIPSKTYCDQPYVVKTDDGAWLVVMTTGIGHEGQAGQHIVTYRSADQGRTWTDAVDVESPEGPEASYAVLLKTPTGRIYCFYNHNTDNIRRVKVHEPDKPSWPNRDGYCYRVDSLGHFVCKYSDNHGRTWSDERYEIPIRLTEIDRDNVYGGEIRFFWNVGKAFLYEGKAYVSLHKVGGFGDGFFIRSEGVLLMSENLAGEADAGNLTWETLPDGERGLRTPPGGGPVAEEQSYSVLSDGSFYVVYRTTDGHPACAYSRDGGHTWSTPEYKAYADGRLVKHPRAANFAWRCSNGKFLYWFHNHGGCKYEDRNPVWLLGGIEADSPEGRIIRWSQPEIVLYDDDTFVRMSYPDLVEDGGCYYLTETQKSMARVHEIPMTILDAVWNQFENRSVATDGLVLNLSDGREETPREVLMPDLGDFVIRDAKRDDYGTKDLRRGFSLDLWIQLGRLESGQILLDTRTEHGQGFCLQTTGRGTVEIVLNDGRTENRWDCDPGLLKAGQVHHLAVIVDGGPKIVSFVVDGQFCDGGKFRQFGWGRFNPNYRGPTGGELVRIGRNVRSIRLYDRALLTSEAIGNYQAGE
ncbi:hypothetical protein HQ520_01245 [bacterium]|nr:hypothetical protein [bacterium]